MREHSKGRLYKVLNILVLLLLVAGSAACGGSYGNAPSATTTSGLRVAPSDPIAAGNKATGGVAAFEATVTTGTAALADIVTATGGGGSTEAPISGARPAESTTGEDGTLRTGSMPPPNYQSSLTAGQVDDNARFREYLEYLREHRSEYATQMDVSQRLFLRVVDGEQRPVAGARVQLYDGQRLLYDGQTVSDGRVLFFPSLVGAGQVHALRAVVSRGNSAVEANVNVAGPEQTISMPDLKDNSGPVALDLVFLLDATGSMGDEIAEIKATVGSIAQRIEQLPGSSAPRFGLVAFRDLGDDYVTRRWDFTSDIGRFAVNLSNVSAGGGGDVPESVNAGLHDAINLPGWADNSTGQHLRMIVLVGDAPPHLDYPNDYAYPDLLQQAVAKGIKIFPIGASNLDSGGEYIFRQFAQFTQGQFVFLTYANGVSGAPGASTTHDVPSDFTVQNLDSLVVRLVQTEVANQTGQQPQGSRPVMVPVAAMPGPVEQPATLLASLQGTLQHAAGEVFSWTSLLWLALLAGMLIVAQRFPQRVRVAPAAATPNEASEAETVHGDIVAPDWDELEVPHPTVSTTHPPYIDYAAPQLTVPLPNLEAALRDYKELSAIQDR
ncbi:MAG TPA: vWA domain-containing protein [Chloroflexia bacterium]|nr:vWA domain-containing protein [Chloroflexia bacterium]